MNPAIEVKDVSKKFLIPHEKRDTLKENVLNVFRKRIFEEFNALEDINLTVRRGEFFGIVGKNGSGKSTLLKIIAGIYQPSKGKIKVTGSIAPFLELGIGFQQDLTARENIRLNATLLGLTGKQIRERFKHIAAFAEIENFLDLKIKNFSSGMRARLAFAIAREADADIYLCDEVLAVGDEAFQQKCLEVFRLWKEQGKTIIMVSHNPGLISEFCTRAVLLEGGKVAAMGAAEDVLARYHRNIVPGADRVQGGLSHNFENSNLRLTEVRFGTAAGEEKSSFKTGESIVARIFFDAKKEITDPVFGIAIHGADGTHISGPNTKTSMYPIKKIAAGKGFIECVLPNNYLLCGQYYFSVSCFDYSCTYPYDYLDRKFQFTIERNRDNQYGLVELPVTWRLRS